MKKITISLYSDSQINPDDEDVKNYITLAKSQGVVITIVNNGPYDTIYNYTGDEATVKKFLNKYCPDWEEDIAD